VAFDRSGRQVLLVTFQDGRLVLFDRHGAHQLRSGVLSASVGFGPFGEVLEVVLPDGRLLQLGARAVHLPSGGGVRSASVAFDRSGRQVLLLTFQDGTLELFDRHGAHRLGAGVLSAGVAFGGHGEVLEVIRADGTLTPFDAVAAPRRGQVL
jgi:hypothetical protein